MAYNENRKMYPGYLNLSKKDLNLRIKKLFFILKNCEICPRKCHINRTREKTGFCKLGKLPMVSSFQPHFGEETPLVGSPPYFNGGPASPDSGASQGGPASPDSGASQGGPASPDSGASQGGPASPDSGASQGGSGTIFFTSCNLACVYCQNYEISQLRQGQEISFQRLAEMMIELQSLGCHNINLVTPTPQIPQILKSLSIAIELGLKIPLVYNTSSYDLVEVLKLLDGVIDIYMPDTKYADDKIAFGYSNTPKYFEIMKKAIKEMHRQVGDLILDEEGIAQKGLLIRHLVLPSNLAGSDKIFEFLAKEISPNSFLNIMDQYHPCHQALEFPELSRRITGKELQKAILAAKENNLTRLYRR